MYSNCNSNRTNYTKYRRSDMSGNDFPPAMAYVPWQYFDKVYDPKKALRQATIFPELDLPFLGKRGCK